MGILTQALLPIHLKLYYTPVILVCFQIIFGMASAKPTNLASLELLILIFCVFEMSMIASLQVTSSCLCESSNLMNSR